MSVDEHNSLGTRAARGVALLMGATIAGKLVSGLGQIVLAWLLLPEDFGLVALAFTVMSFSRAIEQLGLREILIREQDRFDRWVNSAMWLAGAVGLLGALLTAAFAPLAGRIFGDADLIPLVLILAPASPLLSLSQICEARLERDMRYKQVMAIQFGVVASQMILAVTLAALGFGAFSFVLPRPIVSLFRLIYVLRLVRPPIRTSPQFHRWPKLLRNGTPVMGAALLAASVENADYVILGLITSNTVVGFYYFAFMQSTQVVQVFSASLMRVLVPSLSTMKDDPARQARAYLKGVQFVGIAIAPLCVMQAALSGPVLRLLFADKWVDAIPLLQILSISIITSIIAWPVISLIMAQGRYVLRLVLTGVGLTLFIGSVSAGALIGEHYGRPDLGAAIAVLVHRLWYGPFQTYIVVRSSAISFPAVYMVFVRALANSLLTVGPVWWLSVEVIPGLIHEQIWSDVLRIVFVLTAAPAIFMLWMRFTQRSTWTEITTRTLSVLPDRVARFVPAWVR